MFSVGDKIKIITLDDAIATPGIIFKHGMRSSSIMYDGLSYGTSQFIQSTDEFVVVDTSIPGITKYISRYSSYPKAIHNVFIRQTGERGNIHIIKLLTMKGNQTNLIYIKNLGWYCKHFGGGYKFPLSVEQRAKHILISIDGLSKKDFYKITKTDKSYLTFKRYLSKFQSV